MKYATLKAYLAAQTAPRMRMSFEEIASAAKVKLPASAFRYPQWWENDPDHHVQAKAWLEAGYRTERLNLEAQRVDFVRIQPSAQGLREVPHEYDHDPSAPLKKHPAAGALKGTFTISPDWDVTKPAFDEDEMAAWEARFDRKWDEIEQGLRRKP